MSVDYYGIAAAIADIFDHDAGQIDQVEGVLLIASGSEASISPVTVAHETDLDRTSATNLFRQLESANAVHRENYMGSVAESRYSIRPEIIRELFSVTREAIGLIGAYRQRQPPPTVAIPIVTFPDDPAFNDVTPATFGIEQLLSALAREAKATTSEIALMAPFFEGEGFVRLREILVDALDRDVSLTIVTRYLNDSISHNRYVIEEFLEHLKAEGISTGKVNTIDYTVWDESVPQADRHQDGENPAFTLHAKMMLFDERAAYVGSANITDYGFDRYLELGVLLRGPPVNRCRQLYEFLLESDSASPVTLY